LKVQNDVRELQVNLQGLLRGNFNEVVVGMLRRLVYVRLSTSRLRKPVIEFKNLLTALEWMRK
jgi:hypothetical protein